MALAWIGRGAALHVWSPDAGHNSRPDMGFWALRLSSERVLIKELIKAPSLPLIQGSAVREGVDVNIWVSRQRVWTDVVRNVHGGSQDLISGVRAWAWKVQHLR